MAKKVRTKSPQPVKSARSIKGATPPRKRRGRGSVSKSTGALADLPTEVLARELARRRSELPKLERRRAELRTALSEVESRIAMLGGAPHVGAGAGVGVGVAAGDPAKRGGSTRAAGAPRRQRQGAPTLGARLVAFLTAHPGTHQPGTLAETIDAEMGRACTQSFIVSTNAALRKLIGDGAVEKVSRGQYRAKGSVDAAGA